MSKVCSWTVCKDGKVVVNQVGGDVDVKFTNLLYGVVKDIVDNKKGFHGTLETFEDGTQILVVKSVS